MPNRDLIKNRANIRRNQKVRNAKANAAAKRDGLLIVDRKTGKRRTPTGGEAFTRWKNGQFIMIPNPEWVESEKE